MRAGGALCPRASESKGPHNWIILTFCRNALKCILSQSKGGGSKNFLLASLAGASIPSFTPLPRKLLGGLAD